jgi:ribosomal protein S18 acetylase RimI-like enzyme
LAKRRDAHVTEPARAVTIRFDVCRPGDVNELIALLADVVSAEDPPAVAAGITPPEFAALVELYRVRAGTQGMTIVARCERTGALAGALLAEDAAAPFPEGVDRLSRKFDPIFDILSQLDAEYRGGRIVPAGESLHLFLLGVSRDYARRGVAQQLVQECLANGARRGYIRAVTEATNVVSQHVFRKLGFTDRVRRSYEHHRYGGRAVFASIVAHGGPVLLDRSLCGLDEAGAR